MLQLADNKELKHYPVLAGEVLETLVPGNGPLRVIDGTVGYGGHSSLILRRNADAVLLGIDRDGEALKEAEANLSFAGARFHLAKGSFGDLADHAAGIGWLSADAILLDLGVSSPQLDCPGRGFSIRSEGPLDMRMDSSSGRTASEILNTFDERDLEYIFSSYGEVRGAQRLAMEIVARRKVRLWSSTAEFAEFCNSVLGRQRRPGLQAATLCFQALRIAVNDELAQLEKGLAAALEILSPGGRMAVISFHSLEDRIVKHFFRQKALDCVCPPEFIECRCEKRSELRIITKKAIVASDEEIARNRRSGPAKLRVAEKTKREEQER